MQQSVYSIFSVILAALVLLGIKWMSSPETAVRGNRLSALSMLLAVLLVLWVKGLLTVTLLWAAIALGVIIGYFLAARVTMLKMPQLVALLNGFGGGASALVALVEIAERYTSLPFFNQAASQLALMVGGVTVSGSILAALKLDRRLRQQPVVLKGHSFFAGAALVLMAALALVVLFAAAGFAVALSVAVLLLSLAYGILFAMRVGGADMPITISMLNSFSGLAGAICGFTIGEPLLVAVGAIVGASGLILTQIMCRSMNRSLVSVFSGSVAAYGASVGETGLPANGGEGAEREKETAVPSKEEVTFDQVLKEAKKVIIIPGYGMALAQAQGKVKELLDILENQGVEVKFAIHPVAGRMPGHMNVLLAEVDVPYDKLCEMDEINPEFAATDLAVVIGACDVVNPAANTIEGTPIYGMPVLNVEEAKHVFIYNLDCNPGYSGVENPLYQKPNARLCLGNAEDTLCGLLEELRAVYG